MIPFVGPDVEQAIEHLFKLTFLHNAYPIVLFFGAFTSLGFALHKPSRPRILFFTGLMLLFLHFEYQKHIVEPLLEQTQITLTTDVPRWRFIWFTEKFLTKITPIMLFGGGLFASFLALFLARHGKKKRPVV